MQGLASLTQAFAGEVLEDVAGAGDFADGFGKSLAFFPRQQRAELFAAGEDFQADLFQRIGTRLDAEGGPRREGATGGGDGLLDLRGIGLRVFADHVREVGRVGVGLVAIRADPLAVDEVVVALYVSHAKCPLMMPGAAVRQGGAGAILGKAYWAPCFSISTARRSYSSGFSSVSGARTGPAS